MAGVLVTGGTGTLGRVLVPRLITAGHEVRVLSRSAAPVLTDGATAAQGDVRTGEGVAAAADSADVVVHAATNPARRMRDTEVAGARHVAQAARAVGAHLIYVSIVGVDRHRYAYYRAKREAEQEVADSGARWTVQRATQFHDLLARFLAAGVFIRTPNLAFQVVDAGEVADRLVQLVSGPVAGMVPDFAGPEVLSIGDLARIRAEVTGRRARLLRVPRVGFLRDFDAGMHLAPDHRDGRITWERWLQTRGRRRPITG